MTKLEKILAITAAVLLLLCVHYCETQKEVIVNLKPVGAESDHNAPTDPWTNKF